MLLAKPDIAIPATNAAINPLPPTWIAPAQATNATATPESRKKFSLIRLQRVEARSR